MSGRFLFFSSFTGTRTRVVARAAAGWISGPARVGVRAGVKGLGGFWVTACSFLGRFRCGFHRDVEGRAVDISCSAKIFGGRTVDFIRIFEVPGGFRATGMGRSARYISPDSWH